MTGRVELSARIGGEEKDFSGMVVRTEGEVERDSRSIYVVAEIPGETGNDLLQPGLFVEATIAGRVLEDVARVPFRAFVDRDQVAIVDMEKEVIDRRQVRVERRMENDVIVSAGLEPGDWVSITQLSDLVSGMPVKPEKAEISQSTVEPALSTTKP